MNNLKGKVALITGSAKNLGRALAIDLSQKGAKIAINYYSSEDDAKQTLKEINKYSKGILIKADVTQKEDVKSMFQNIETKLGSVDILINLVGNFIYEPITSTSFEKFKEVIESNLYSTYLCTQYALPFMQKKRWGRIINFGCVGAESLTIREKTTPYYIAKTGVIMLTKVMAYEYAKYGITINSISPGILKTSVAKPFTPIGRFAKFSDIINTVDFLIKEESSYINGANIEVSGGLRLGFSN